MLLFLVVSFQEMFSSISIDTFLACFVRTNDLEVFTSLFTDVWKRWICQRLVRAERPFLGYDYERTIFPVFVLETD